jgi:hypothetical protein
VIAYSEQCECTALYNVCCQQVQAIAHALCMLFEDLFVVGCEALFVVWVGKVYLTLSYDQAVSSGLHDFG